MTMTETRATMQVGVQIAAKNIRGAWGGWVLGERPRISKREASMDDRLIDGHGGTMPFLCRLVTSIASYGRPKRVIHVPRIHVPLSTGVPVRYGYC